MPGMKRFREMLVETKKRRLPWLRRGLEAVRVCDCGSNPAAEREVSEFQIVFWDLPCPSCREGGKEGGRAAGRWGAGGGG